MYCKEYLLEMAKKKYMCKENIDLLTLCESKSEMIRLYKKTIDWALERNYPNLTFLRKEFSEYKDEGLFIDHIFRGELLNEHQVYVFHNCIGTIKVGLNLEKKIIPMLYFANNCEMEVIGIDNSRVPLYIFGENDIQTKSNFIIYRH